MTRFGPVARFRASSPLDFLVFYAVASSFRIRTQKAQREAEKAQKLKQGTSESVNPYTPDRTNWWVPPPRWIHDLHPGDVMPTDDIRAWIRFLRNECSRGQYVWGQAIVSRIIERGEWTDDYVLDLFFFDILCGLLQALPPIDIRIVKQIRPSFWTTCKLIEVRNVIGETGSCCPNLPRK